MRRKKTRKKAKARSDTSSKAKRVYKKKATRANAAPKTRASNTMSDGEFFSFIRSALRQKSRWWKPKLEVKMAARRPYKGQNKRQRFEYQCNICKDWFIERLISIDHILPVGSLRSAEDLPEFVERLFCEKENLQCVCAKCHSAKTLIDKVEIKKAVKAKQEAKTL